MRLVFDTDVVLDLLLDRRPFSEPAAVLFSRVEAGDFFGYVSATSVTAIHYLATKAVGAKQSKAELLKLLSLLDVAPVNRSVIEGALGSKFSDFEDAVVHEAARQVDAGAIVTRNVRDFKYAVIPVYSPAEMFKMLKTGDIATSQK